MAKHITVFDTQEQYNAFKDSSEYVYPNISYVRGGGSVINKSPSFQTKEVEITENGEIEVTPDAGFSYLNSVKVKTNVPTSGEGGGSTSSVEYIDVSGDFDDIFHKSILVSMALQIRAMTDSAGLCVASYAIIDSNMDLGNSVEEAAQAISIDTSTPTVMGGGKMLISDYFNALLPQIGLSIEWYNALPRLTKEQFYNIA